MLFHISLFHYNWKNMNLLFQVTILLWSLSNSHQLLFRSFEEKKEKRKVSFWKKKSLSIMEDKSTLPDRRISNLISVLMSVRYRWCTFYSMKWHIILWYHYYWCVLVPFEIHSRIDRTREKNRTRCRRT